MNPSYIDLYPGLPLQQISPASKRALSWLARASQSPLFKEENFVQIAGGANMLGGLDYHYENFNQRLAGLDNLYKRKELSLKFSMEKLPGLAPSPLATDIELSVFEALQHEAFAYLNRLGQFYAFAKAFSLEVRMPYSGTLMLFRNKHTAHRSIDAPRKDDTLHNQRMQAMAFGFFNLSVASFPVFQISNDIDFVQFHMRDDHPKIMAEAFDVLQGIHSVLV